MKQASTVLLIAFFILCFTNLYAEWIQSSPLIFLTKPLLISSLALYFFWSTTEAPSPFRRFILLGLLFSIGGDTLLMFVENEPKRPSFFVYGLASFLLTHLCYLYAFMKWPLTQKGFFYKKPWLLLFFLFFLMGNAAFLWPDLTAGLRIPVLLYSIAILAMTISCIHLYGGIPKKSFQLLLAGVLLFVFSDNIIALNKFKSDQIGIPYARLVIMISYLVGQFLIVRGAIVLLKSRVSSLK